jgi:hypothetical protein
VDSSVPTLTVDCSALKSCHTNNADALADVLAHSSATDGCDGTIAPTAAVTGGTTCNPVITVTATDRCGNTATKTCTARVDSSSPSINCPADKELQCGESTATSNTGMATAQDGCGSATVSYSDLVSPGCGGSKVIARTWTATDACGNSVSCVQRINLRDTTPPSITCRAVQVCTYSQGGWSGGGSPAQLLASNYTTIFPQGVTLGIYNPANGDAAPNGLYWQPNATGLAALQVAFSVGGGSSTEITHDAINPTDTYGANGLGRQTLALICNIAFNTAGLTSGSPNDFGSLIYAEPGDSLSGKTVSQILEIANRALAGLGLPAGYDFSSLAALVNDLNLSFHDCTVTSFATSYLSSPSIVLQCPSQVPPPDPSLVSASDTCSSVTLSVLPDIISDQTCPSRYTITRVWVVRDACGNTSTCSYKMVVNDTTAPTLACKPDRSVPTGQAWDFDTPVAADNCGAVTVRVLSTVTNVAGQNTFVATRTWEAVDACGNTNTCQQTITFTNTAPPVLELHWIRPGWLQLRWAAAAVGFQLQACDRLTSPNWSDVAQTPVVTNGFNTVEFMPTVQQNFYRLRKSAP